MIKAQINIIPVLLVFLVVIVGIYGGWANPTEAAAIGAAACGVLAVISGGMRWEGILESMVGTAQATAMIFLVLLGADMLNTALAVSQMPVELATWVKNSGLSPLLVMLMILIIYVLLGCVMDSLATLAFNFPASHPRAQERSDFFKGEVEQFLTLQSRRGADPFEPRGSSATYSTRVGHLKCARRSRAKEISASAVTSAPSSRATTAIGVSSHFGCGTPTTATSRTASCRHSTCSTSMG